MSTFPRNYFDSATLDMLQRVLDDACQHRYENSSWEVAKRELFAQRIYSRAVAGERDPSRLLHYALLSRPANSN